MVEGLVTGGDESIAAGVRRDLEALAELDPELATSADAMTALAMAARIDDPQTNPTAAANCARALGDALERLRDRAPEKPAVGAVTRLQRRALLKVAKDGAA